MKISRISDSFFRSGHTRAAFIDAGNIPLVREAFTMLVNSGRRWSVSRSIGFGSREHMVLNKPLYFSKCHHQWQL